MRLTVFAFVLYVACATAAVGDTDDPLEPGGHGGWGAASRAGGFLTRAECIRLALVHNLGLMAEGYNPKAAEQDVVAARAEFDAELSSSVSLSESEVPNVSRLEGVDTLSSEGYRVWTEVSKKLATGALVSLGLNLREVETNATTAALNPRTSTDVGLGLNQPLLRGAGFSYNRSKIELASAEAEIARLGLKDRVMSVVFDVVRTYWGLVYSLKDLEVSEMSLKLAEDFRDRTAQKIAAELLPRIDIFQPEADVASRRVRIVELENEVANLQDELKKLMDPDGSVLGEGVLPTPSEEPVFRAVAVDERAAMLEALEKRPEVVAKRIEVDNKELEVARARNQLRPRLDAFGNLSYHGVGEDFDEGADMVGSCDFPDWTVGLSFSVDLGNRAAKSTYQASELRLEQSRVNLKDLEKRIELEVRSAARRVNTNALRVARTETSAEWAKKRLGAEEEKYELGQTTSFNVLQAQEDLAEAERDKAKALVDYLISLDELENAKGTLLEAYGMDLEVRPTAEHE